MWFRLIRLVILFSVAELCVHFGHLIWIWVQRKSLLFREVSCLLLIMLDLIKWRLVGVNYLICLLFGFYKWSVNFGEAGAKGSY